MGVMNAKPITDPFLTRPTNRPLPNERVRWLMLAAEREMGSHGLRLVLRQASLDAYIDHPPPANRRLGTNSAEYSRLIQAVRTYYGLGARGVLTRMGRTAFQIQLANRPLRRFVLRTSLVLLPAGARRARILRHMAAMMSYPAAIVSMHSADQALWLVDPTADRTLGVTSEAPLCATALGEIAEALLWATGREHTVDEVVCRASGGRMCRFEVL